MLSESQAKKLIAAALKARKGEALLINLDQRVAGNTRFAANGATTNGDVETLRVSVTASSGGRSASVTGNASDSDGLRELVVEAQELAALSPVDPESMPPLKQAAYAKVRSYDKTTAKLGAKARVAMAGKAIAAAKAAGLQGSGFMAHADSVRVVGNSEGLFAYQASTRASLSTTCRTPDGTGSGRAVGVGYRIEDVDAAAIGNTAAQKAKQSAQPQATPPGDYTVLLEAQAVYDLLSFVMRSMSARSAEEGRSWFSDAKSAGGTKLGQTPFSPLITMSSDPADPANPASAFTSTGAAHGRATWIDKGKIVALTRSRFWAQKTGQAPAPRPSSLHLRGESKNFLELLGLADKGILVTRFWYNRMLERRSILATGLTRDGTFAIEGGKISHALKNLRYNDSPLTLLRNVVAMGRPQRVETRGDFVAVVPPMVVRGFHFDSSSDAV